MRLLWISLAVLAISTAGAAIPTPFNTESSTSHPLPADEAAATWQLPEGFQASVFASEPAVCQPISMCLDDRGRLWVAESYMYAGHRDGYYESKLRDRIVIFEDTDGDGRHDKRTVFCDGLERLTSIEVGLGGVWALTLPNLVFIPDGDHDDKPDGAPHIVLKGFNFTSTGHTMANGLRWGPDGWLYGRQGILGVSMVGEPGASDSGRTRLNTGIWRYHPQRKTVEVFCEGTTNPWGMDWNEHGEAFFINTVIGHLWHAIPGAHFVRMFGSDNNPHVYDLIDQHADHVHWDTREVWSDVKKGVSVSSSNAGGGHAHTGLMIYLGENWPETYRGQLFTINFHGRRLNQETLKRTGSGYTGRHAPDLAQSADEWFRGIDLLYGPDGGVFVSDWSDTGECHDDDGIHRESGRIYKITHGRPAMPVIRDVAALSTPDLVSLLAGKNEWYVRRARLQLQERTLSGPDTSVIAPSLLKLFSESNDLVVQLRALWALHAIQRDDAAFLRAQLVHPSEYVRAWAIRLLLDDKSAAAADQTTLAALIECAKNEASPLVRLALASGLQRVPLTAVPSMAAPLLAHPEDATDHNLPLMLWYGIEPLGATNGLALAQLSKECAIPLTRRCIARRLSEDLSDPSGGLQILLSESATAPTAWQVDFLTGMSKALEGMRSATPPVAWHTLSPELAGSKDPAISSLYRQIGSIFKDPSALALNRNLALDTHAPASERRKALRMLTDARPDDLHSLCMELFGLPEVTSAAANGLALSEDLPTADFMINHWPSVPPTERAAVLGVLLSRSAWASQLLDALEAGKISPHDLSAYEVRQIRAFNDPSLTTRITALWGGVKDSTAEKQALIKKWTAYLIPALLAGADKPAGRALFMGLCANCHKMYGEGGSLGPELTGSGRDNLAYLLGNIADPSAVVAKDYQLSIVTMKDGRILSGMVRNQNERTLSLQTPVETTALSMSDIAEVKAIPTSLMPEGLLETFSPEQVRDLIAWLMDKSPSQSKPTTTISPAEMSVAGDWKVKVSLSAPPLEATLDVTPPIVTTVKAEAFPTLPLYNVDGGGWNNGAHLAGNIAQVCSTPDLIDISSVTLRPSADPESPAFVRGKDWEIENSWGTLGRLPGGTIGENTPVFVSYRHTSLRLDTVVLNAQGIITLKQGANAPAAPQLPTLALGEHRLGNIWIPGPIPHLTPDHLFPITEIRYPELEHSAQSTTPLKTILEKLRNGEPVRILAWGDSVTECIYLPEADKWQQQFVARLRATYPTAKIELLTEAWGGVSSGTYLSQPPGALHNFQEKILNLKPDLIISEFVNDAAMTPQQVQDQYGKVLTSFRSIGAAWIIIAPHYTRPSWMGLSKERDVDADPRPYIAAIREFTAKNPVMLADASLRYGRLWRQGIPFSSLMVNSVNHPNAEGMKIFADALIPFFRTDVNSP